MAQAAINQHNNPNVYTDDMPCMIDACAFELEQNLVINNSEEVYWEPIIICINQVPSSDI